MKTKLSHTQFMALCLAYAEDHDLTVERDFGVSPRTAKALASKGLLEADDDLDEVDVEDCEWEITPAGKRALGIPRSWKPKLFRPALKRAIRVFFGAEEGSDYQILKANELWRARDEGEEDWTGCLAGVRGLPTRSDDAEILWDAVGTMLNEAGLGVYADLYRDTAAFWPSEED